MSVSPAPGRLFILPSTRMRALRRIATGGLRVLPDGDDMTAPFHLIDNADGEITQGDRLLLWRDGRIECFDATGIVSCAPVALGDLAIGIVDQMERRRLTRKGLPQRTKGAGYTADPVKNMTGFIV